MKISEIMQGEAGKQQGAGGMGFGM